MPDGLKVKFNPRKSPRVADSLQEMHLKVPMSSPGKETYGSDEAVRNLLMYSNKNEKEKMFI